MFLDDTFGFLELHQAIDVINVRKKIKNVKNAFFIPKIKDVCKRDKKRYRRFYLLLITDIN